MIYILGKQEIPMGTRKEHYGTVVQQKIPTMKRDGWELVGYWSQLTRGFVTNGTDRMVEIWVMEDVSRLDHIFKRQPTVEEMLAGGPTTDPASPGGRYQWMALRPGMEFRKGKHVVYMLSQHEVYPGWENMGKYFGNVDLNLTPQPPGSAAASGMVGYWYNLPWSVPGPFPHETQPGQERDNPVFTSLYGFQTWNEFGQMTARADEWLADDSMGRRREDIRPWHNYQEFFMVRAPVVMVARG